jgi:hypothetical protein
MTQAPPKTAPEILTDVGRALFDSEDWQMRFALALGVNRSTIQFWRNGKMRFGPDHPALVRLLELADRRAERSPRRAMGCETGWPANHRRTRPKACGGARNHGWQAAG